MVSGKLLLVFALLLVLGTDSKPYNPFEDLGKLIFFFF